MGEHVVTAFVVADSDGMSALSADLGQKLASFLSAKGYEVETIDLNKAEAAPCRGCLLCLTKHPGRCVTQDAVGALALRLHHERDPFICLVISPVLFGHLSSTMKNAMDRGVHSHHLQAVIGHGEDVDEEEESTFIDLVAKHRGAADIVHPGMDREFLAYLTRSMQDNDAICDSLGGRL
ncbi:MAG: flavodoxin family protein [Dehalococcoidia bacterium]|nr:flavodoxin family protein [Dehalococcoidia bacterium]